LAGAFTDIVSISAPSSAQAGETVNIIARVKNTYSAPIGIQVNGTFNSSNISFPDDTANVNAGATHSFYGSFTMPSHDVDLSVWSWYYGVDGYWHFDDSAYDSVDLEAAPPQWYKLASLSISAQVSSAPPPGWVKLTTIDLAGNIAGVGGWYKMASFDLPGLIAGIQGWYRLATMDIEAMVVGGGPPTCSPGETKCIGQDLYRCSPGGDWVLDEENSPQCQAEGGVSPWLLVAGGLGAAAIAVAATGKKKPKVVTKKP
jgi:hypothetical protein